MAFYRKLQRDYSLISHIDPLSSQNKQTKLYIYRRLTININDLVLVEKVTESLSSYSHLSGRFYILEIYNRHISLNCNKKILETDPQILYNLEH